MLRSADEGVQNLIDTMSKVIGGRRESETTKRRSPFPKRDVHDGEASGIIRLTKAFMGASNTGKGTDRPVLHRPCRISVGLEHADLIGRHAEFKGSHLLYLVSYDSEFQTTRNGKAPIPSQALCILCPDKQSIREGPDRPTEQSNALPFRGRKKTCGYLPVISGKAGQKLGKLRFNKLNVVYVQFIKDVPRQFDIASGHVSRFIHIVERRLDEISDPHVTITTSPLIAPSTHLANARPTRCDGTRS